MTTAIIAICSQVEMTFKFAGLFASLERTEAGGTVGAPGTAEPIMNPMMAGDTHYSAAASRVGSGDSLRSQVGGGAAPTAAG